MKKIFLLPFCALMLFLVSCGTTSRGTLAEAFPEMYTENPPVSILVMPPINKTTNVDAKDYFYYTLHRNLADGGYYVFPSFLAMQTLQTESAYDSEMFFDGDISKFGQTFGAELLLFTTIESWDKSAVLSETEVEISYTLRSTATGATVWSQKYDYTYDAVDTTWRNALGQQPLLLGFGYFIGYAIDKAVASAKTALTDYVRVARSCNYFALTSLPAGKYSPNVGQDGTKDAGPEAGGMHSHYTYN